MKLQIDRKIMPQPLKKNKNDLSPAQQKELLGALKARFEKNMNRHRSFEWANVQAKLEANTSKTRSINGMERTGGDRMSLITIKRRANTLFMIVPRKVLKAAEVFATTVKRWSQGKKINQKVTPWIWQQPWALTS
jgi:hypothetical protein